MANITVVGTGYVGLVSGACLADFGNFVTCVDNNVEKIEALKRGSIPIYEPGLEGCGFPERRIRKASFTTDLTEAIKKNEVAFIRVGTPPRMTAARTCGTWNRLPGR